MVSLLIVSLYISCSYSLAQSVSRSFYHLLNLPFYLFVPSFKFDGHAEQKVQNIKEKKKERKIEEENEEKHNRLRLLR